MQTAISENDAQKHVTPTQNPKLEPPPIELLGQGVRAPTAQELAQEQRFNEQQIAVAEQWLKSPDPHQRIMGAEQLSAFESPHAEQLLVDVVLNSESDVRIAAIRSLGTFKSLSNKGLDALVAGLGNSDKNSRFAALNAIFDYAAKVEFDTEKSTNIIKKLQKKLSKGNLNKDIRHSLDAFINDKKPTPNAFFSNARNTSK